MLACGSPAATSTSYGHGGTGGATGAGSSSDGGESSSSSSSGSSSTSTSTSTSGADESSASTAIADDSSTGFPDFGPVVPPGCAGKIDFLFMISNRSTMAPFQAQLKAALPAFIDEIDAAFADFDVHIMAMDPEFGWGLEQCSSCYPTCEDGPPNYPCYVHTDPWQYLNDCDYDLGAGVTFPVGWGSTNHRCELAGGHRYITADEPDRAAAFECIATVGISGGARPAEGVVRALSDELNGPGGCNEGFVRPDALLVVVVISREYDEGSKGKPSEWAEALVTAKGGDEDAVSLLMITTDIDSPDGICYPDELNPDENPLRTWTSLVPHGRMGSICEPSWGPFFAEATQAVLAQCEVFVPQ